MTSLTENLSFFNKFSERGVFSKDRFNVRFHRQLARLANQGEDTVIITNRYGIIEYVNPAFEKKTGHNAADVIGKMSSILDPGTHNADFHRALWDTLLSAGTFRADFINKHYNGSLFHEDITITPLQDDHGRVTHFAAIGRDITSRVKAHQKMQRLAYYDSLTGLPNRSLLTDRLNQALKRVQRHHKLVAVMFLDLDDFKNINDSFGHDMGDRVIAAIATRLRSNIRESDTIARYGGDEFVIMLEDIADQCEVSLTVEKLLASLNEPYIIDDNHLCATASIGVALAPIDGQRIDQLLKNADRAMYRAKMTGGGGYEFFNGG